MLTGKKDEGAKNNNSGEMRRGFARVDILPLTISRACLQTFSRLDTPRGACFLQGMSLSRRPDENYGPHFQQS
jgi:hypothetical protein